MIGMVDYYYSHQSQGPATSDRKIAHSRRRKGSGKLTRATTRTRQKKSPFTRYVCMVRNSFPTAGREPSTVGPRTAPLPDTARRDMGNSEEKGKISLREAYRVRTDDGRRTTSPGFSLMEEGEGGRTRHRAAGHGKPATPARQMRGRPA